MLQTSRILSTAPRLNDLPEGESVIAQINPSAIEKGLPQLVEHRLFTRAGGKLFSQEIYEKHETYQYYTRTDVDDLIAAQNELSELSDVTFTTLTSADILQYNGTEWVNTTFSAAGGTGYLSLAGGTMADGATIKIDNIWARDSDGLGLYDDAGNLGVFIEDGGQVGINQANPNAALDVVGNILVSGNVDGVDVAALKTDVDGFPDELKNLVTAEIQQVENIGATTISAAQWGYLGALTATDAELNTLDGYLGSVTEFNYLKDLYDTGVTSTEYDYLDGVTSFIQTQLNTKVEGRGSGSNTRIAYWTDSNTIASSANLTFSSNTLAVTGAATISTTLGVTGNISAAANILLTNGNYIGISAAGRLEFYTAGYAAFMGCNVGIGTANPNHPLHQHVSGSGSNYHRFTNDTTGVGANDGFVVGIGGTEIATLWNYENTRMVFATNSVTRITIREGGYVGIGISGPDFKLHVFDGNIRIEHSGAVSAVLSLKNSTDEWQIYCQSATGDLRFWNGADRVTIEPGGNIGIGTNSPRVALTLENEYGIGNRTYSSGWAGSGWDLAFDSSEYTMELDSLFIRGALHVYELIINQISAVNGGLIISAGNGRVASVPVTTPPTEQITFEDPESTTIAQFAKGDILLIQNVNLDSTTVVKRIVREVNTISGMTVTCKALADAPTDAGEIKKGDVVVVIGNTKGGDASVNVLSAAQYAGTGGWQAVESATITHSYPDPDSVPGHATTVRIEAGGTSNEGGSAEGLTFVAGKDYIIEFDYKTISSNDTTHRLLLTAASPSYDSRFVGSFPVSASWTHLRKVVHESDLAGGSTFDTVSVLMTLFSSMGGAATDEMLIDNISIRIAGTVRDASIFMTSTDRYAPYIQIMDEVDTWAAWKDPSKIKAIMGNLEGKYGFEYETYGFAAGDRDEYFLTIDPVGGLRILDGSEGDRVLLQANADTLTVGEHFVYTSSTQTLVVAGWVTTSSTFEKYPTDSGIKLDAVNTLIQIGDPLEQHMDLLGANGSMVWYRSTGVNTNEEVVRIDDSLYGESDAGISIKNGTQIFVVPTFTNTRLLSGLIQVYNEDSARALDSRVSFTDTGNPSNMHYISGVSPDLDNNNLVRTALYINAKITNASSNADLKGIEIFNNQVGTGNSWGLYVGGLTGAGNVYIQDKLGIGTDNPGAQLHISSSSDELLRLTDTDVTGNPFLSFFQSTARKSFIQHNDTLDDLKLVSEYGILSLWTGTAGTEVRALTIDTNQRLGIRTLFPDQILDVNQGSGNMIADGYDTHSMRAYKENIVLNPAGFLDKLKEVPFYEYRRIPHVSAEELKVAAVEQFGQESWDKIFPGEYDHQGGKLKTMPDGEMKQFIDAFADTLREERRLLPKWEKKHYGIIADDQELIGVLPEVVNEHGTGISLNNYVGFLHGCIKELEEKVSALEAAAA